MDKKILGYTKIELLIVIVLLGIVAFITINRTSYAFSIDNKEAVSEIINLVELQAVEYATDNVEELFSEGDTSVILVSDLIDNGYMMGNNEGKILNPLNNKESYNNEKIDLKIDRETNKITATFRK